MRGVLHAEVFGFNFFVDINPYQRSDDCVIAAGQIMERPDDAKTVWRRSVPLLSTSTTVASNEHVPHAQRYGSKLSPSRCRDLDFVLLH